MEILLQNLYQCKIPFRKQSDVDRFLTTVDEDKNPVFRIIAWILSFNIINFNEIEKSMVSLVELYKNICGEKLSNFNDPRSSLPKDEGELLRLDTERTIFWFKQMASNNGIDDEEILENSIYQVQRILSTLSKTDSFYRYMQGYDRYVFITFLLGLQAMKKLETETIFAESMSYFLCREFLKIVDVNRFTQNNKFTVEHFANLDKELAYCRPEIYDQLSKMHVSSVHFAMKWELLCFSDEHQYPNILLIWDHIIANKKVFLKYVDELCIAHIRQIKSVENEFIIQTIQTNRTWNTKDILNFADKKINNSGRWTKTLILFGYLLLFFIMVFIRLYFYDDLKLRSIKLLNKNKDL